MEPRACGCTCGQVSLSSWPAGMAAVGWDTLVTSPSNQGDGFAVINNTLGNLRGRGVLCKSSYGVIAGNRMFNLKGFGVQAAPELYIE